MLLSEFPSIWSKIKVRDFPHHKSPIPQMAHRWSWSSRTKGLYGPWLLLRAASVSCLPSSHDWIVSSFWRLNEQAVEQNLRFFPVDFPHSKQNLTFKSLCLLGNSLLLYFAEHDLLQNFGLVVSAPHSKHFMCLLYHKAWSSTLWCGMSVTIRPLCHGKAAYFLCTNTTCRYNGASFDASTGPTQVPGLSQTFRHYNGSFHV